MKKKRAPDNPYVFLYIYIVFSAVRCFSTPKEGLISPITPEEVAQVKHPSWVPLTLLDFAQARNGFSLNWTSGKDHDLPQDGSINVLPLQRIFGDWQDVVYFDHEPTERQAQLRDFKIVDFFVDEACVGCYYRPERDEQLYYFDFEDLPQPLGVDFWGYLTLLPFTLGYRYWQYLLLDLYARPVGAGPFQPARSQTHRLVERLQAVVPSFDLAAFVVQYEAVRLPR